MKAKESLQYNGKVLLKERKKQKLSRIDIALKLTLNEHQIKSIEENLATGFTNDHFKKLSIKRYAKVLVVPIEEVIPETIPEEFPEELPEVPETDGGN